MSTITDRLAFAGRHQPGFTAGLGAAARGQAEGPLDARTTRLIYLGALAALGAEESFRFHLHEAMDNGITEAEALHAALCTFTAAGITPLLKVLDAFLEEPRD
jgi:alkylhydroperoxidase/carboxymuconolactone decarboxylase family protein YurZ